MTGSVSKVAILGHPLLRNTNDKRKGRHLGAPAWPVKAGSGFGSWSRRFFRLLGRSLFGGWLLCCGFGGGLGGFSDCGFGLGGRLAGHRLFLFDGCAQLLA